jgi:hypothetical protein
MGVLPDVSAPAGAGHDAHYDHDEDANRLGPTGARTGRLALAKTHFLDYAAAPPAPVRAVYGAADAAEPCWFAPTRASARGALFMVVEGVSRDMATYLHQRVQRALDGDRGTATARLLRAVRAGCQQVEARALHRFELAGLGLSALLVEDGSAYLTQLPPSQVYAYDGSAMQAVPDEPMRGAARVGSAAGRRWQVEIDLARFAAHPGAAFVLCSSPLAHALRQVHWESWLRLPVGDAAATLVAGRRTLEPGAPPAALVIRVGAVEAPPRARLISLESQRRLVRPQPGPPLTYGVQDPLPIEAWGLRRRERGRLPLTSLFGSRVAEPPDFVPARRSSRRPWVAAGLGLPAGLLLALVAWRSLPGLHATPAPAAGVTPVVAAPALAGRTLLLADEPFHALAVAGGRPYVGDRRGRIVRAGQPGEAATPAVSSAALAPAPATGLEPVVALAVRDGEVLALDAGQALWRLVDGSGPAPAAPAAQRVPLARPAAWRQPVALAVYAGNLYVLDGGVTGSSGQIWRYTPGAGGAYDAAPQAWLQSDAGVSLAGATSLAIDGLIWVGRADGTVLKLNAGRAEPFAPAGLDAPVAVVGAIYTERGFASLYLVDSAARRLLRLAKDGRFETQVTEVFGIGEHVRGLWVDESSGRALILTDQRLQEVAF